MSGEYFGKCNMYFKNVFQSIRLMKTLLERMTYACGLFRRDEKIGPVNSESQRI
jgi:hypothetical protein